MTKFVNFKLTKKDINLSGGKETKTFVHKRIKNFELDEYIPNDKIVSTTKRYSYYYINESLPRTKDSDSYFVEIQSLSGVHPDNISDERINLEILKLFCE
jgi:hypothetical protein